MRNTASHLATLDESRRTVLEWKKGAEEDMKRVQGAGNQLNERVDRLYEEI